MYDTFNAKPRILYLLLFKLHLLRKMCIDVKRSNNRNQRTEQWKTTKEVWVGGYYPSLTCIESVVFSHTESMVMCYLTFIYFLMY